MRIYVAGPMTGYPNHNFGAFNREALRLRGYGHEVINPADTGLVEDWAWTDYLRLDLGFVLDVDLVATLAGWQESPGAALEVHVAHALKVPVLPVHLITPATNILTPRKILEKAA